VVRHDENSVWYGGSSPHQPFQAGSGHGPVPPPNMFLPSRRRRRSRASARRPPCWRSPRRPRAMRRPPGGQAEHQSWSCIPPRRAAPPGSGSARR
jgi:hypothetical protein